MRYFFGLIFFFNCCIAGAQQMRYYALFTAKICENIDFRVPTIEMACYKTGDIFDELVKYSKVKSSLKVQNITSADEVSNYTIVFIGEEGLSDFKKIKALAGDKTIIITQGDGYIGRGANICFFLEDEKLGFRINKERFTEQGYIVSKSLITLSR